MKMKNGKERPTGSEESYVKNYLKREKIRPKNRDVKKLLGAIDHLIYKVSTSNNTTIKVNIYDMGFEENLRGDMEAEAFFKNLGINLVVDIEGTEEDMSHVATLENFTLSKLQNLRKKLLGLEATTKSRPSKKRKEIILLLYTDLHLCRELETNPKKCYVLRWKNNNSQRLKILEHFINNQVRTISSQEINNLISRNGTKGGRSFKEMFTGIARKLKFKKSLYYSNNNGYRLNCKIVKVDKPLGTP